MPRIDEAVINFAVYEDAVEYLGKSEVTLPEVSNLTEEIKGAGIAGNVEAVILGHTAAMSLTLNFRTVTPATVNLFEPRIHNIDLRTAQQETDTKSGEIKVRRVKYALKIKPKKFAPGKVAPGSPADASGEYAVLYYAVYIDGVKKMEIDPLNFIYEVNGKDYLSEVRSALGK